MHCAVIYHRIGLLKMDALSKQLHHLSSLGKIGRDLFAFLPFEYPRRLYSTFSAICKAECGLRPFHFCQFFGGEALV